METVGKSSTWQRYEQKLGDERRRYSALLKEAFPEVGKFHVQGWPMPGHVEFHELAKPEVTGYSPDGMLSFSGPPWRRVEPKPDTFADFLALADATPGDVFRFAKRYGPILARYSEHDASDGFQIPEHPHLLVADNDRIILSEFTSQYVARARGMRRAVTIAQALRAERREAKMATYLKTDPPSRERWRTEWTAMMRTVELYDRVRSLPFDVRLAVSRGRSNAYERLKAEVLSAEFQMPESEGAGWRGIERYLETVMGGNPFQIPAAFSLVRGRLALNLVSNLGSYLNMQLLTAVGRGPGLAMCAGCSIFFLPKRRLPPDRQAWCIKCARNGASVRAASRRYYERHKSKVIERINNSRGKKKVEVEI